MLNYFNSLFELAVAFNFAYVASETIRELFSRGFLSGARNLSSKFDIKLKEVRAKLTTINDSLFPPEKKQILISRLEKLFSDLKGIDSNLDQRIDSGQKIVTNKLKSIYILSAFYSLFVLFLSGMESFNTCTMINELIAINIYTIIMFICLILMSFTKRVVSVSFIIVLSLFIMSSCTIFTFDLFSFMIDYISQKNIIYGSVVIAFSPFVLITIRIFLTSLFYEIIAWFYYLYAILYIKFKINKDLKKLNDVDDIFNDYS